MDFFVQLLKSKTLVGLDGVDCNPASLRVFPSRLTVPLWPQVLKSPGHLTGLLMPINLSWGHIGLPNVWGLYWGTLRFPWIFSEKTWCLLDPFHSILSFHVLSTYQILGQALVRHNSRTPNALRIFYALHNSDGSQLSRVFPTQFLNPIESIHADMLLLDWLLAWRHVDKQIFHLFPCNARKWLIRFITASMWNFCWPCWSPLSLTVKKCCVSWRVATSHKYKPQWLIGSCLDVVLQQLQQWKGAASSLWLNGKLHLVVSDSSWYIMNNNI